jgi:hypothetical protein
MSSNAALKLEPISETSHRDDQVQSLRLAIDLLGSGYDFLDAQAVATGIIGSYHPGEETRCGAVLRNVHVIPHPHGWAVLHPGKPKISIVIRHHGDAVQLARKFALDAETSLVLHDDHGRVLEITSCLRDY